MILVYRALGRDTCLVSNRSEQPRIQTTCSVPSLNCMFDLDVHLLDMRSTKLRRRTFLVHRYERHTRL